MKQLTDIKNKLNWEKYYNSEFNWDDKEFYKTYLLSEGFLQEFFTHINWRIFLCAQSLSESFIEKNANRFNDIDWELISTKQKLSEAFIEKMKHKVNWKCISEYQTLSEKFIRKFANKISWYEISKCQKLSLNFIKKYSDKLNWTQLSLCQNMPETFIKKNINKIHMIYLFVKHMQSPFLSEQFIKKYQTKTDNQIAKEYFDYLESSKHWKEVAAAEYKIKPTIIL